MKQSLASCIFDNSPRLFFMLLFSVLTLLLFTIISKNKVNMTVDEARREYRKEIIKAYHQGWVDGFDAFINRTVTTDMVQMQYEADKNNYLEKKGE